MNRNEYEWIKSTTGFCQHSNSVEMWLNVLLTVAKLETKEWLSGIDQKSRDSCGCLKVWLQVPNCRAVRQRNRSAAIAWWRRLTAPIIQRINDWRMKRVRRSAMLTGQQTACWTMTTTSIWYDCICSCQTVSCLYHNCVIIMYAGFIDIYLCYYAEANEFIRQFPSSFWPNNSLYFKIIFERSFCSCVGNCAIMKHSKQLCSSRHVQQRLPEALVTERRMAYHRVTDKRQRVNGPHALLRRPYTSAACWSDSVNCCDSEVST